MARATLAEMQEMEKNIQLARFYRALAEQREQLSQEQQRRHLSRAIKDQARIPEAEAITQLAHKKRAV